jgi:hypothetical protein
MVSPSQILPAVCLLPVALLAQPRSEAVVTVPATSNPYLAGMPRGTTARFNDVAPAQSPVLVELSLANAVAATFKATGAVEHGPYNPPEFAGPGGAELVSHAGRAEHGISDMQAPMNSLIGVFLSDDRPDRTRAPKPLDRSSRNAPEVAPQLKQIFFIGPGLTKTGVPRRFLVPKNATRLFLAVMDGYEWSNNDGAFSVAITIERSDVSSNMFTVDSRIFFADWACLPDRSQCTPDHPVIKEAGPGRYHIILPANLIWGASIATAGGAMVSVQNATGTVCLDSESRSTGSCNGPRLNGKQAGEGFLLPDKPVGALVMKMESGRMYFSVNDRDGAAFQRHEGYFEFDVTVK